MTYFMALLALAGWLSWLVLWWAAYFLGTDLYVSFNRFGEYALEGVLIHAAVGFSAIVAVYILRKER